MVTSESVTPVPLHEPVERFRGSHADLVGGLDQLRRLPALAEALRQARASANATLALFEKQVVPHHVDEEQVLFVAVTRSAGAGAEKERVKDLVSRLIAQHRRVEQMWAALRPGVLAIAAGKPNEAPGLADAVTELVEAYLDHVRLEEQVFLPLADEILARDPNHMAALDLSQHFRHWPMPRLAYM